MTNFAWANPITGVREIASTLEEARYLVWQELSTVAWYEPQVCHIFEQQRAGIVTKTTATREIAELWNSGYAFASPVDGKRAWVGGWDITVRTIQNLLSGMEEAPDSVIIYRQREVARVLSKDPAPEAPAPPRPPAADTPESLIASVSEGTCYDLQRAQILAMLWIAEALQERYPGIKTETIVAETGPSWRWMLAAACLGFILGIWLAKML